MYVGKFHVPMWPFVLVLVAVGFHFAAGLADRREAALPGRCPAGMLLVSNGPLSLSCVADPLAPLQTVAP